MIKNFYFMSLIRDKYDKKAITVTEEQVIGLIRQNGELERQTVRFRATRSEKDKDKLPRVSVATEFDGVGKAYENLRGFTGYIPIDIDHLPQERMEEVRTRINADKHTVMAHLSPSGDGFHVIAKWECRAVTSMDYCNEFTRQIYDRAYLTANCHYADLVNHRYDEQCENHNRTLTLCHDARVQYNPDAEPFVIALEQPVQTAPEPMKQSNPDLQLRWEKVERDPMECAIQYVEEKVGISYTKGYRNHYLMRCLMMMNLYGVPQTDAERWALGFDLGQREIKAIVKSCYKRIAEHGTFEVPYEWVQVPKTRLKAGSKSSPILHSNNLTEGSHAHTRAKTLEFPEHQWPHFIQQMLGYADSKPQKDVMLLAIFTVLGAMIGRLVRVKYSKRFWHPTLQVFIVAPPASGKGVIGWVRHLAEPLHDKMMQAYEAAKKQYDKDKAAYDNAGKERTNMECPQQPAMKMFLIAGNNSSTGILENLADAEGHALICESEADTLSAAINADYGNWDDTLRKAHDHDRLSYNRRTNKEYRQIQHPCVGVLICGTPAQVKPLIPSAENGLFSRQIFGTLPAINQFIDQFDDDDDNVDVDTQFYQWGKEWLSQLEQLRAKTSCIRLRLSQEQRETFNGHFSQLFHHAHATQPNHHMTASVAREGINVLRIMEVVALLRALEETSLMQPAKDIPKENVQDGIVTRYDLFITDDDFQAVIALAEPIYRTACDILSLLPVAEAVRNQQTAEEQLLANLPLQFSRKEAIAVGGQFGINEEHVDVILGRLFKNGKLKKPARGNYEFVFPNDVQIKSALRACA